ncbi:MAG: hypothetical protein AABY18_02835 [Candidatus Thermoplasmatota archaeon]
MRLRSDSQAASPLVVIATFVLGAIVLTAIAYAFLLDRPEPRLQLVAVDDAGGVSFEVTHEGGSLDWDGITLRFLDRAGTDQAGNFLQPPTGDVDKGDRIGVSPLPPAGTYLLLVMSDGDELSRLVVEF